MKQYMVWQRGLSLSLSGEKDEQVRTGVRDGGHVIAFLVTVSHTDRLSS